MKEKEKSNNLNLTETHSYVAPSETDGNLC